MALDRLTIRAKKSISDLFSRVGTYIEPSITSDRQKENGIPDAKGADISSMSLGSVVASLGTEPPCEESPSKRKGLMGSLRKQKLRSIGSLRSIRSPTRVKQADMIAYPAAGVDVVDNELVLPNRQISHTPNPPLKSSLALDFQESPPGQPIFDLSTSSSLDIHHSSPVPVPCSDKQSLRSPSELSVIPSGTVPSSPAPIQKVLELDRTGDGPSRIFSSCRVSNQTISKAANPVEKPISDILRAAADYYHVPTIDGHGKPMSSELITQTVELRQADSNTYSWNAWSEYRRGLLDEFDETKPAKDPMSVKATEETKDEAPGEVRDKQKDWADTRRSTTVLDLLRQKQCANIYRRADGKRQMQVRLTGSDPEKPDEAEWRDKTGFVSAGRNEDFTAAEQIVSNLGVFVRDDEILVKAEGKELTPDQAHAAGKIPAYVDIELEPASNKEMESGMLQTANMGRRGSSWGAHAGLYDGTGYGSGSGSTSRPTTAVNETKLDHDNLMLARTRTSNLSTSTASSATRAYKDYADFEDFLTTRHAL